MHTTALRLRHGAVPAWTPPMMMIMADASASAEPLRRRIEELEAESNGILAQAEQEGRDLDEAELARINSIADELEKKSAQAAALERIAAARPRPAGRRSDPEPVQPDGRRVPAQPRIDDPRGGFRSLGDFAMAVRAMGVGNSEYEGARRLQAAATTYGNEGTGADGGFAVPPEFRRSIWQKVMGEDNLLNRCERMETASNNLTIPKDETTPWQTSGGIQVYWEAEAATARQSKPALETISMRLQKLMALVPITEELMDDAPGLESWLRAKAPEKIAARINTAIVDGTGVGQPLGFLRAPCTITVAAEGGQGADTILYANVNNMWSRMYAPARRRAVWLINQDIEPQLNAMAFDPAATSKTPVYLPAGGVSASPFATLFGRPVVAVEACKTLGDRGDINLVDLTQYMVLTKAGQNLQTDVSMHLYFDQAMEAFRFILRINGQPLWGSAIQPQHGNLTRSAFVTLAERA